MLTYFHVKTLTIALRVQKAFVPRAVHLCVYRATNSLPAGRLCLIHRSIDSQRGNENWRTQKIRLLHGTSWCIADGEAEDDSDREGSGAGGGFGGGVCEEHQFQVLAAEATEDASAVDEGVGSLLILRTDRGTVELSPPGRDDRDSMLIGFGLLLASSGGAGNGGDTGSGVRGFMNLSSSLEGEGGVSPRSFPPDRGVARRRSRRWEGVTGRGGGNEGMVLESADEDTDSDDHQHQH